MTFDKILASRPVNKQAARALGGGVVYEPTFKGDVRVFDNPLPLRPVLPGQPNLAGKKFGKFTCLGLARDYKKNWLVRCVCGKYELRTARAISNPDNFEDSCVYCRKTDYLMKEDAYRRLGKVADAMRYAERSKKRGAR